MSSILSSGCGEAPTGPPYGLLQLLPLRRSLGGKRRSEDVRPRSPCGESSAEKDNLEQNECIKGFGQFSFYSIFQKRCF